MTFGIFALYPIFRPGPSSRITEERHRLFPSETFAVANEVVFPVLTLLISAGIDKRFELLVGHLVPIDPVVVERQLGHSLIAGDEQGLGILCR